MPTLQRFYEYFRGFLDLIIIKSCINVCESERPYKRMSGWRICVTVRRVCVNISVLVRAMCVHVRANFLGFSYYFRCLYCGKA